MSDIKKHALLSPSSSETWMTCPGSIELQKPFPNNSSIHSRWGTAAHDLAERCLPTSRNAEDFIGQMLGDEGEEVEVDMEMADCVNTYISYVHTFLDPATDKIMVEQALSLTFMTGEEGAEGTSDVVGITRDGTRLVVIDLKGGKGKKVSAKYEDEGGIVPNPQIAMYGRAALRKVEKLYDIEDVQLVIIQPRLDWVDDHIMTVDELIEFGDRVSIAAGRTQIGNAELVPSDRGCLWCRAKSTCPALRDTVLRAVTVSDASSFEGLSLEALPKALAAEITTPDDSEELAAAMRATALVEGWIKAVRAEVERRLFAGTPVPGYKIVQGKKGNRQWKDEEQAFVELRKRKTLDVIAQRKPISPTAAEKVFKDQPKVWAKICELIEQKEGGPSVAPESDPRPPYAIVSEASAFTNLTTGTEPVIEKKPFSVFD